MRVKAAFASRHQLLSSPDASDGASAPAVIRGVRTAWVKWTHGNRNIKVTIIFRVLPILLHLDPHPLHITRCVPENTRNCIPLSIYTHLYTRMSLIQPTYTPRNFFSFHHITYVSSTVITHY